MKKIIRLTESELHDIVKESVTRILNEGWTGRGYVPHDGNGMVGGYYGRSENNGQTDVMDKLLENVPISPEEWDGFCKYCEQNPNVFVINGLISSEYDDSTGYGPTSTLEDTTGEEEALQYVAKYPDQRIAQLAVQTLKEIFDKLTDEDFELYDNEYEPDLESDER